MATVSSYIQGAATATKRGFSGHAQYIPTEVVVDFSVTPVAAADVIQLFHVPPGMKIIDVATEVLEGSTPATNMTFDVGIVADPNAFIEVANGETVAANYGGAAGAAAASAVAATAKVISMTIAASTGTTNSGKIRCRATMQEVLCS